MIITLIVFLLILTLLVLIHELGHYLAAKKFGIKVEEFGFGFPPRAFGIKKGETIYSINWLPIGGFVKLFGEDDAGGGKVGSSDMEEIKGADRKRAFFARPVWQRAVVVVAGVVMNVLLAIFIYYSYLFITNFKADVPLLGDYNFAFVNQRNESQVIVSAVASDSPAQKAGIKTNEQVLSVDGVTVTNAQDLTQYVKDHKGKEIKLVLSDLQTNKTQTVMVTPRVNPPPKQGALGVGLDSFTVAKLSYDTPVQKVFSGIIHPLNLFAYNLDIIGKLVAKSFQQKNAAPISQGVSGPVGIYSIVGIIVQVPDLKERILDILNLAGLLSMSLAFFNILPIPALDGGRLFFILFEGITGRKVNQKVEGMIHTVGMAILLSLLVLITFKDISQFFIK